MEIIRIENIRKKWFSGWKRKKKKVYQIVIHGTGGGHSAKDLLNWMYKSGRKGYKKGIGLFHYAIDKDGTVYEIISPDRWVYHSTSGWHDKKTIGVELINSSKNNEDEFTSAQYKSLYELFEYLRDDEDFEITSFIGHGRCMQIYSKLWKNCPGNFNWEWLMNKLDDDGFDYMPKGANYIKRIG